MSRLDPNLDARRALGVRPGALPIPKISFDDSFAARPVSPTALAPPSPTRTPSPTHQPSPKVRDLSLSLPPVAEAPPSPVSPVSPVTPVSPVSPSSPEAPRRFRRPTLSRPKRPVQPLHRGLYETQKLLSHVLDRLDAREPPPDLLDRAAIVAREVSGRAKGKSKARVVRLGHAVVAKAQSGLHAGHHEAGPSSGRRAGSGNGVGSEDFEDGFTLEEGDWDIDQTLDLVEQMRSLLVLADKQGLDLFEAAAAPEQDAQPIRAKTRASRFASIASPITPTKSSARREHRSPLEAGPLALSGPHLLTRCLDILRTLIETDCLHRIYLFSPLRPPYSLQSACLDVATFLYHKCDEQTRIEVVEVVVDGLFTMGPVLAERLCEWIEGRLGELLGRLARERGGPGKEQTDFHDPFQATVLNPTTPVPTFAISEPVESRRETHETHHDARHDGWMRFSPARPASPVHISLVEFSGLLSTYATDADTSSVSLRLAALVPRLLVAITSTVDPASSKLTTIHRVHRLLTVVFTAKPDSALDLLEIAAHGQATARRAAVELLATFFPQAMGHNVVARRPALSTYAAHRSKWETGQDRMLGEDDTEGHHWLPWRSSSKEAGARSRSKCDACDGEIRGFALRCTLCGDLKHLHCYQPRDEIFQFDIRTAGASTRNTTYVKFGLCPPPLEDQVLDARPRGVSVRRREGQHDLRLVNLFNLGVCRACHEPLWGCSAQAFACLGCQGLFHPGCTNSLGQSHCQAPRYLPDAEVTVTAEVYRRSYEAASVPARDLASRSYDEIAVLYGYIWTQYQLEKNGLASGSIRVEGESESDVLGLRQSLRQLEDALSARAHEASPAATDFAHVAGLEQSLGTGYLFSDRFLTYCVALLRAPSAEEHPNQDGFLTASGAPDPSPPQTSPGAYEMLQLSTLRRSLAVDLNIHDDAITALLLDHLRSVGLCTTPRVSVDDVRKGQTWFSFTLPLLMDSSPTVELLVLAIEGLLADLDLAMNEQAMILLFTRAWPSILCSTYALERLGNALVAWVMAEDDALHQIVKLYASKHRRLPGVRAQLGSSVVKGTSSVSLYQEDRKKLLQRYAQPWLAALHDLDPSLYASILYDQCKAPDPASAETLASSEEVIELASRVADVAMERMAAVLDADVVFSSLLELLASWLEDLGALADRDVIYRSLPRLLRHSNASNDGSLTPVSDIWEYSHTTAMEGAEGLERVCRWMRVLSFSGVEIPWPTLLELAERQDSGCSVEAKLDLVIAVNANGAAIEPGRFPIICADLFDHIARDILAHGRSPLPDSQQFELVRHSLLLLLRAYGVSVEDISSTSLSSEKMPKQPASLSKRRRMTALSSRELVDLDDKVVLSASRILATGSYPVDMLLDFLWLLLSKASLVGNIDGAIYKLCPELYETLWPLMDSPVARDCRARLFLRLLSVNPAPMEEILQTDLQRALRYRSEERLLRFLVALADDTVTRENTSWRRATVGLLLQFLESLISAEPHAESLAIRKSLPPTHLGVMSACLEEALVQSSDEKRLELLSRAHRLRAAFPTWPMLSWRAIEELVTEEVATVTQLKAGRSTQTLAALADAQLVRSSLLSLALWMLASSVPIPWVSAQRLQQHVAALCVVPWSQPTEGLVHLMLPALRAVLDSPAKAPTNPHVTSSKDKRTSLIGSLFVPIIMEFGNELGKQNLLAQRSILDILLVTFFKQNLRVVELAAMGSLQAVAGYVSRADCAENRLLAISVIQTAVEKADKGSLARIVPTIFCTVGSLLVKEYDDEHGDSSIIGQSRALLKDMVKTFGKSGLFLQAFKVDGSMPDRDVSDLARTVQMIAKEESAQDTTSRTQLVDLALVDLSDVLKRGRQTVEQVLLSLCRFSHGLSWDISEEASQSFGTFLGRLAKHVAEWDATELDPNPIISTCAALLRLAPPTASQTLLHQTSTLLHLCLSRFEVKLESATELLNASDHVFKQLAAENTVRTVMFELAGSALSGLAVAPETIDTLLSFLSESAVPFRGSTRESVHPQVMAVESAPGCLNILLRAHPTIAVLAGPDSTISILESAASVLLKADITQPGILAQTLSVMSAEASSVQLGVFTYLLLASLGITMGDDARGRLLALYPILARDSSLCLRAAADLLAVQDAAGSGAEMLSVVFVVIRLSLLAAAEPSSDEGEEASHRDEVEAMWNRIWPDWFRLISISLDPSCVNAPLRAVAHSVFLDLVIFLSSSRSHLLVIHAGTISHALQMLVHYTETSNGQGTGKLIKAVSALEGDERLESLTRAELSVTGLAAIRGDLLATERLRALRRTQG